jgi:hypothetical protein
VMILKYYASLPEQYYPEPDISSYRTSHLM